MTLRKAEFLDMTPKTQSIHRKKFDILDFIKAKNFVLQNTEKTNNRLGKYLKIIYVIKNLYPELYKELLQLNNEIIITQLKKRFEQIISQIRYING